MAGTRDSELPQLGNAARVDRILAILDIASMSLAKCLAATILAILAAQVLFRFALNQSLIWSEEVAAWCMVWLVYLGAAALTHRGEHVSIPFFLNLLPAPLRRLGAICRSLAMLLGVLFITIYGIKLVFGTFHIVSQATGINSRWIKLCIPISGALMTLFTLRLLVSDIRAAIAGDPGAEASGNGGSGESI